MYDRNFLEEQIQFTKPEYRLFVPRRNKFESENVHLHVIEHKQYGGLIAFWTQSSTEQTGDNHIVEAYSRDNGQTWSEPRFITGARTKYDKQASWGCPIVSSSGRIYLLYSRENDVLDGNRQLSASFSVMYSDDFGDTWSKPCDIPMRVTPYDYYPNIQSNVVFQMPRRMPDGKYLCGFTKWNSYKVFHPVEDWQFEASHLYFMRFENIDDDPEPEEMKITCLPEDEHGVTVRFEDGRYCAQEPCWTELPDGRLFCSMRTMFGCVYYTVSDDLGKTWRKPEPLRFADGSQFIHSLSPSPIYHLGNGRYVQLYHGAADPDNFYRPRNPIWKAYGTFKPDAEQPIQFPTESRELFMELPPESNQLGHDDLSLYGSCTRTGGRNILWYPDRKFFLLGKEL